MGPLFKKNWSIEISPVGLPELIELNHLKDSVPVTAKDRLYEVGSMAEAWDILDKVYGKEFDLRNKIKHAFLSIEISAKFSPLIEIEIFQKVHKIACRIKAAKAQSLLENDFEYISLVYQLLPKTQREKWVNYSSSNNPTWDSFYKFLEDVYEKSLLKKQINEACEQNSADNCYRGTVLAATVAVNACPVCNDSLHYSNTKEGTAFISKRLISCPKFKVADDDTKNNYFQVLKVNCQKYVGYAQLGIIIYLCANMKMLHVQNVVVIILMRLVQYNKFKSLDNLKNDKFLFCIFIYFEFCIS